MGESLEQPSPLRNVQSAASSGTNEVWNTQEEMMRLEAENAQLKAELEQAKHDRDMWEQKAQLRGASLDILEVWAQQAKQREAKLLKVVHSFNDLISESRGVDGFHKNGDIATWDEFDLVNEIGEALQEGA